MNILSALLYGFISGITEILPVSSGGHQAVFRKIFGESMSLGIYNIFVHIGVLLALFYSCRPIINRVFLSTSRNALRGDRRVVKDAMWPFIILSLVLMIFATTNLGLLWVAALFVLNGIILFIPSCIATGNKTAKGMSILDSIMIGISGALAIFPGLSRISLMTMVVSIRGGDRKNGIIWVLALSVPAMIVLIIMDIYLAITQGVTFYFSQFLHYLIAMLAAFGGVCIAVRVLRKIAKSIGIHSLAYYSWGMAILTFILYLMV